MMDIWTIISPDHPGSKYPDTPGLSVAGKPLFQSTEGLVILLAPNSLLDVPVKRHAQAAELRLQGQHVQHKLVGLFLRRHTQLHLLSQLHLQPLLALLQHPDAVGEPGHQRRARTDLGAGLLAVEEHAPDLSGDPCCDPSVEQPARNSPCFHSILLKKRPGSDLPGRAVLGRERVTPPAQSTPRPRWDDCSPSSRPALLARLRFGREMPISSASAALVG